jgi:hypothetical protein
LEAVSLRGSQQGHVPGRDDRDWAPSGWLLPSSQNTSSTLQLATVNPEFFFIFLNEVCFKHRTCFLSKTANVQMISAKLGHDILRKVRLLPAGNTPMGHDVLRGVQPAFLIAPGKTVTVTVLHRNETSADVTAVQQSCRSRL